MRKRFKTWFQAVDAPDLLTYRMTMLFQSIIFGLLILCLPMMFIPLVVDAGINGIIVGMGSSLIIFAVFGYAWYLARHSRLELGVTITVISSILLMGFLVVVSGLEDGSAILLTMLAPLVMAGLLGGRRTVFIASGLSVSIVLLTVFLEITAPEIAQFVEVPHPNYVGIIGSYLFAAAVIVLVVDRFSGSLREALQDGLAREKDLEALRETLEQTVQVRTATLEKTLQAYRQQGEAQQQLIEANQQQRTIIRELSIPILPVGPRTLVLPLVGELNQSRMNEVKQRALEAVSNPMIERAVLDITGVPVVDSEVAAALIGTIRGIRLLGAEAVIVGVRPEVAQSLVTLDVDLSEVQTYATLQNALEAHF